MYSSTTRGRIHLLQFPHVHGISFQRTLTSYIKLQWSLTQRHATLQIQTEFTGSSTAAVWFRMHMTGIDTTEIQTNHVSSESNNQLIPPDAFRRSHTHYSHCLVSRAARDRVRYKVSAQSYLILFLLKSCHKSHI